MLKDIPAFPATDFSGGSYTYGTSGMTLRDYFAGQWLTTFVIGSNQSIPAESIAVNCYKVADAMMKEREKE